MTGVFISAGGQCCSLMGARCAALAEAVGDWGYHAENLGGPGSCGGTMGVRWPFHVNLSLCCWRPASSKGSLALSDILAFLRERHVRELVDPQRVAFLIHAPTSQCFLTGCGLTQCCNGRTPSGPTFDIWCNLGNMANGTLTQ